MHLRPENQRHRMLISLACLAVLFTSIMLIEGKANAQFPPSGTSFVKHFKKGDYGHYGKHKAYSATFKRIAEGKYMAQWRKHHKDHGRLTAARENQITQAWWDYFTGHDTCNSGMWGSTPNCDALSRPKSYAKSIYGTGLTDNQRKWTLRIAWCGGLAVASFYTDGMIDAAIGRGALPCFGSLFVP